ncbi:MAG: SUMF1/EgtB/PvdO family nonheme iron enzyme [Myxococcales bacterium]|nr:SUMF1/EgtB/PvdO family nonheme iron enzyme [Myxococcales bacterium]
MTSLLPTQRRAARSLLMRLVTIDDTRASLTEEELVHDDDARQALEAMVRGRILGVRETDEGVIYEIVHEALINGWGTLRRWLDDEQESRALRHRIEAAAAEWERLQRPSNALWSAAQVDELKAVDLGTLRPREAAFLEACRRHVQRGRRIRRALVVAIPLALAGTYGGVRVQEYRALQARVAGHVETASAALEAGRGRVADVDRQQRAAYEKFDARAGEEGEALWAAALKVAGETDEQFKEAAREYETALMLDPGREDIRGMVGDVLLERALLAERVYAKSRVDEQLERLALYDPDGSRLRRWEAPGSLTLRTTPPGARVSIDRYEDDGRLLQLRDAPRDLGATPITSIELAQGSYVLRLELEGRHATTLPLRIGRDAASELEVALPERGAVPEGYIYIPAGRSMFGSSQEALRNTFHFAAPLHEVWTDAYIIARREVTFAEWIEFLEAQPPEERPKYGPNTEANGLMTRLSFEDGAWKLSIVRGGKEYAAVAGEPLVLSGREERRAQDWLKLPVSGISVANAAVYVQWVDASGRLPGARLCTGHEWERAARGADARIFPHGHALEPGEANIDVTYNREQTNFNADIGGSYAASRSPFGVDDLTGNVVELTTSSLEDGVTVARGGGFYLDSISAQIVNRQVLPEEFADSAIGLRVCASFPLKSRGA